MTDHPFFLTVDELRDLHQNFNNSLSKGNEIKMARKTVKLNTILDAEQLVGKIVSWNSSEAGSRTDFKVGSVSKGECPSTGKTWIDLYQPGMWFGEWLPFGTEVSFEVPDAPASAALDLSLASNEDLIAELSKRLRVVVATAPKKESDESILARTIAEVDRAARELEQQARDRQAKLEAIFGQGAVVTVAAKSH